MRVPRRAAAALLLIGGCSGPAPPPPAPAPSVTLSTSDTAANVGPIVALFRRTCLDAANDNQRFPAAVAASGWPLRRVHAQDEEGPSRWRFDHGELGQWNIGRMTGCFLMLQSTVAPAPAALRAAFRPLVQRPGFTVIAEGESRSSWAWPSDPGYRMVLTINADRASPGRTYGAGRQAVSLSFVREQMPAAGRDRE